MEPSALDQEWEDPRPRGITPQPPYSWQNKKALEAIRLQFDGSSLLGIAIAVYCALTEIASDSQADYFETTIPWIARKAGASVRSVNRVLAPLEAIPVVKIKRKPKLKGPSTYTLLSMTQAKAAPCQAGTTIGQAGTTIGQERNQPSGHTLEESNNEPEGIEKKSRAATRPTPQADEEWLAGLANEPCYAGLDVPMQFGKASVWCREHRRQTTRRFFVNWLNRCERPISAGEPSAMPDLPAQLFTKEANARTGTVIGQIKIIKADVKNWDMALKPGAETNILWLRENKPDSWAARIQEIQSDPASYAKSKLKPEAKEQVHRLNAQIELIKKRMVGE